MPGPGRPPKSRDKSPSSTPVPSTEQQNDGSQLPDAEWDAMSTVLNAIYDYRTEEGFDPSKLFHKKVNKRLVPDYYDTIKEPIAMSIVKAKINTHAYQSFSEFVRDFALIPHNAQVFNRPDSGAFQDALVIKEQLERQLQLLVNEGIITQEVATLPDLGEIPTYEEASHDEGEVEGEDEEESDEEGDDDDDDEADDEEGKKRRRGTRGSTSARRGALDDDERRARGRPRKLDTPEEARIQAILRNIRRPRNGLGHTMIRHFDRLPDKAAMPEYYAEIKNPMAYDQLKRKAKRKKYKTVEEFMADVNLMFNNAKLYNTDDSEIYKDAVALQIEAKKLCDEEKAKPDDSFADEEGKIPMPNGVLHNGELYKVGQWVHIQNPNDLTKPIPCQIFRTFRAPTGQSMVNVCWYYRPEQTVHRYDKHFYDHEVVKTGRYRDHQIDEIEGRCFIMFYTRFFKGRPRGLPEGTEVYVCQARYNEAAHYFNTIKTWASCLPDEVRDKDYAMDLFDHPRKMKKLPSPIAYLLREDQQETDDLPKVQWGADGAPPKIGAVHRRPRAEKDSPPPESTPPPSAKLPSLPPRHLPPSPVKYSNTGGAAGQQQQLLSQSQSSLQHPPPPQSYQQHLQSQSHPQTNRPSSTGVRPSYTPAHPQQYSAQPSHSPIAQRQPSLQPPAIPPSTPQSMHAIHSRGSVAPPPTTYTQGGNTYTATAYPPRPHTANYRDPPPIEVYTLPAGANLSIPLEIRAQYQCDELGNVLFFATPPVRVADTESPPVRGHSVRYLAEKARRAASLDRKRKDRDSRALEAQVEAKRIRIEEETRAVQQLDALQTQGLRLLDDQLAKAVQDQLGDLEIDVLVRAQKHTADLLAERQQNGRDRAERRAIRLGDDVFGDHWDSRIGV